MHAGYVSHCGSDSEDSDTDVDALLAHMACASQSSDHKAASGSSGGQSPKSEGREEKEKSETPQQKENGHMQDVEEKGVRPEDTNTKITWEYSQMEERSTASRAETSLKTETADVVGQVEEESCGKTHVQGTEEEQRCYVMLEEPASETSDSGRTDSRFLASLSSDSMDALEEDDFMAVCSNHRPTQLSVGLTHNTPTSSPGIPHTAIDLFTTNTQDGSFLSYAALSIMAEGLPSPPEASDDELEEEQILKSAGLDLSKLTPLSAPGLDLSKLTPLSSQGSCVFTFEQCDARQYYNICSNVTPDSARSLLGALAEKQPDVVVETEMERLPILHPPPGFGDSSSDDEFFDAQDRFTSPEQPSSVAITRREFTGTFHQKIESHCTPIEQISRHFRLKIF